MAFVPAFVVRFAILIVGTTVKVAVPLIVPDTAFSIEERPIVKFLPPPTTCVTTPGNVNVVAPAAIVAVPLPAE